MKVVEHMFSERPLYHALDNSLIFDIKMSTKVEQLETRVEEHLVDFF